jgi:hypothetical protein
MVTEKPWTNGSGTIEDVRQIMCDFYEKAGRKPPDYFPADEPAEKEYNTGRLMWQRDIQGDRVTFESEPGAITANFDREGYEVYDYEKRLPKRFMSEKSATSVYIGAPEEFAEWVGFSVEELLSDETAAEMEGGDSESLDREPEAEDESSGFLSKLLGR